MKNLFLLTLIFTYLPISYLNAQDPLRFFPHQIGDRWDYRFSWGGTTYEDFSLVITHDSVGDDNSRSIFYNNENYPRYKIDTSNNVYLYPNNSFINYLWYKLDADSGEVWQLKPPFSGGWAWVAHVESAYVFSQPTIIKTYRYSPGHPDSTNVFLEEDRLASGFGLIYHWQEPYDFTFLRGCVIDGDTFGNLIHVGVEDNPNHLFDYQLMQNYPNPFNPSTTIEFIIPSYGYVTLDIYDILGRRIDNLFDGWLRRGNHKFTWNAVGFPSGVYLCRLNVNGKHQSFKMLLAK
jgi:hypothetical protein